MPIFDPIPCGTVLDGRYRIGEVIGAGGMGAVYSARHEVLGRQVAIKVMHAEHAKHPHALDRFVQEAQTVALLGHEHICEALDFGTTADGLPYLVMPLLAGAPLSALMGAGQLTLGRLVLIGVQILQALEATHARKVIHRDLKPDNIFVTQGLDGSDFVKLLDFGISKVLDGQAGSRLHTGTGAILGTTHYMAPEQARGARRVGPHADLYSLGVVLYEAASGQRPFTGANDHEVLYHIVAAPLVPMRRHNPALPREFEALVLRAMARDPAGRFNSAADMRVALERLLTEERFPASQPLPRATREPQTVPESDPAPDPLEEGQETVSSRQIVAPREIAQPMHRPRRWVAAIGGSVALALTLVAAWMARPGESYERLPASIPVSATVSAPAPRTDISPVASSALSSSVSLAAMSSYAHASTRPPSSALTTRTAQDAGSPTAAPANSPIPGRFGTVFQPSFQ